MRPLALALLLLLLAPAVAGTAPAPPRTRVAVLDSGIDASHPEFDAGQVVAWRDLIAGRGAPYDDNGHGTATASLAAGQNRGACGSTPKLAFSPGAPLVVAKVLDANGTLPSSGMLAAAVDWAVAQGAGVISISIGNSGVYSPDARGVEDAFRRARDAGVLVLVSAGNGRTHVEANGNSLHTTWVSWLRSFSNLDGAIVVGSATGSGVLLPPRHNLDPDIASWGYGACVARPGGGYFLGSGTSFATPLVAGMAAGAMDAARDAGAPHDALRIREVVLLSASNGVLAPYAVEGLGLLLEREWPRVVAHAAAGTLPDYDAQGPHAALDRQQSRLVMPLLREPPVEP